MVHISMQKGKRVSGFEEGFFISQLGKKKRHTYWCFPFFSLLKRKATFGFMCLWITSWFQWKLWLEDYDQDFIHSWVFHYLVLHELSCSKLTYAQFSPLKHTSKNIGETKSSTQTNQYTVRFTMVRILNCQLLNIHRILSCNSKGFRIHYFC